MFYLCFHTRYGNQGKDNCGRMLEDLLSVHDLTAVQFFLDMAAYEGFSGEAVDNARNAIAVYNIEDSLRHGSR